MHKRNSQADLCFLTIAAFVTQDIKTATLTQCLCALQRKVVARATQIVSQGHLGMCLAAVRRLHFDNVLY